MSALGLSDRSLRMLLGTAVVTVVMALQGPAFAEDAKAYVDSAKKLLSDGNLRGAEVQLRNAVRAQPDDGAVHAELAGIYLKLDNLPAAEAEARLARQYKASPDLADPVLAQVLMRQGKANELFQLIRPADRDAKAESEVRLALGLMHLNLHELDEAEPLLKDAERLSPDAVDPILAVVRLRATRGDKAGAESELARARSLAPDKPEVVADEAMILRLNGDNDGALAIYDKVLAQHPDDLGALINRGAILIDADKLGPAQTDLDHALKLAPRNLIAMYFKALLLARKGDLRGADDILSPASASFALFPDSYYLAGALKYRIGQFEQADAYLSKFTARVPSDARARRLLALVVLRERNFARVISILRPAVDSDPSDLVASATLAQAYIAMGEKNKAVEIYQRAASAQPDDAAAQTRFASMEMQTGDTSAGLAELNKIIRTDKGADIAGPILILTDLRNGKISEAEAAAEGMVQRNGKDLVAQSWLGVVRIAQQNLPDAEKIFKAILQRDPNFDSAQRKLAQIDARTDRSDAAKALWQNLLQKRPNDMEALIAVANLAVQAKEFDQAAVRLKQLREAGAAATPENARAEIQAALLDLRLGDPTQDLTELEKTANTAQGASLVGPMIVLTALRDGDIAKAAGIAEAMVKLDDKDVIAKNLLGGVRVAQEKYAEAETIFQGVLRQDPDFVASRRNLAELYVRMGRIEDAKKVWGEVLQKNANDVVALEGLADIALGQKDYDGAAEQLKKAQTASKVLEPGLRLIQLYASRKDWKNALSAAQELKQRFPDNAVAIEMVARVRADSGDTKGAVEEYRRLAGRFPNSDAVMERYAAFQMRAGDNAAARGSLKKALALAPDNPRYMAELVNLDSSSTGIDAALATARSFAPQQQIMSDLLVADALARVNRLDEAIAGLSAAQQQHPDTELEIRLAELTVQAGKAQRGQDMLEAWLNDHKKDVRARLALADMYRAGKDDEKASRQYELVYEQAPDNALALNNLAWLYTKKHDARANDLAKKAFRLTPTPQAADTLGWALVGTGDPAHALAYLRQAGAALPSDPEIQYHLAVALKSTSENTQARAVLERLLKSGQAFEEKGEAQRLLDELERG